MSKVRDIECDVDNSAFTMADVESNIVRCPDQEAAKKMIDGRERTRTRIWGGVLVRTGCWLLAERAGGVTAERHSGKRKQSRWRGSAQSAEAPSGQRSIKASVNGDAAAPLRPLEGVFCGSKAPAFGGRVGRRGGSKPAPLAPEST